MLLITNFSNFFGVYFGRTHLPMRIILLLRMISTASAEQINNLNIQQLGTLITTPSTANTRSNR